MRVHGTCYVCGYEFRMATPIPPAGAPREGSVSVCWGCGALGFFTDDGEVRPPTEAEAAQLARAPEVQSVVEDYRRFHSRRN